MFREISQFDPYEYARWQVASEPEPTPWPELASLPPKQAAFTLITEREIPGLKTSYWHQTLIVDTLTRVSPEEVVCVERDGVAILQAQVPKTDLSLKAKIDLRTIPERRPIYYSLHQKDQPDLEMSLLGPMLSVETPELQEDLGVRKALGLSLVLNSPPPHRIFTLSCRMLPSEPLPQTILESVRDLNEGSADELDAGGQRYVLRDGYSEEKLKVLTRIPTFRSSEFLGQLADVIHDAYDHAEIVPISEELSR